MTQMVEGKHQGLQKLRKFQEFIFVSDSAIKTASESRLQLQLTPGNNFLDQTAIGDVITIQEIDAPRNIMRQLQSLKFQPKQRAQLVSKTNNGSVIVNLNNTLIGLGQEIAQRVVVTLAGEAKQ